MSLTYENNNEKFLMYFLNNIVFSATLQNLKLKILFLRAKKG